MEQVLLITGASRGIGAATARLAGQRGWRVVVNYQSRAEEAQAVVDHVVAAGSEAVAIQADVSKEAGVLALFEQIHQHFGRLDGLVNNAGVVDQVAKLQDMDTARLQRMLRINVLGPMLCAREAVRRMALSLGGRGGAIVNIGSAASRIGSPGQYVDYAASKGALDTFTLGLAREVASDGIRVNSVRPGIIDTDIHASGGQPNKARDAASGIPMLRAGHAQEVAQAVLWLLSEEASYTTGALLDVAGGR